MTDTRPFREWSAVLASDPIRQGDIVEALDSSVDSWTRRYIVVTADCDLAHDKHGGYLSCVPVVDVDDYIVDLRSHALTRVTTRRLFERIHEALSPSDSSAPDGFKVSPRRLEEWLLEEEPHTICDVAGVPEGSRDEIVCSMQALKHLTTTKFSSVGGLVEALGAAKLRTGEGKTAERARASAAKDIANSLQTLPGDAMFLSSIGDGRSTGYVAYLRRVRELHDGSVATSMRGLPFHAEYVRLGRLEPTFIHALTQRLASVFGSIGLPTGYEDALAGKVEEIISGASGVEE